ncbi:MAG: class I tRNA ligase family protein, partial [Solirubrobacterales bacterium]|nr:class I tRNA ligase family protein [Solirubrobacterales bacterium]
AEQCDETFCAGSVAELRAKLKSGGAVPEDLHRPFIDEVILDCRACGGEMRRVPETIDAWYDSGAMPFAQFHYPFENEEEFKRRFPADFICEGIDQTRGWFYSQLAESVLLFDESSYRNCVCLGLILDPDGQKMSKSRGNVVSPNEVIDAHGADALRWYYLTSQQPWAGYRFSVETIGESVRQFLLTLWNTYSFLVLYENAAEGSADADRSQTAAEAGLDRWAISRLQTTVEEVRRGLDDFDSVGAGRAIADYVDEMSNWYVRVSRRRFWEGDAAAFATLRHCLTEACKLLAPFIPFTADAIYVNLSGGAEGDFGAEADSVHLCDFPEPAGALRDLELEQGMAAARRAVELGRAARGQAKAKMRQPLAKAVIVATEAERATIEDFADVVRAELNVKALEFVTEEGELASYVVKPNFRSLGPRFGKDMPQARAAVESLDPDHARAAIAGEREIGIRIGGTDHTLHPEDMTLVMQPLDGYQVESESGRAVALALDLDDDLIREGMAREVVRAIQTARKDAGLEITDRIVLRLGGDEALLSAAREHESYVTGETLATSIAYTEDSGGGREVMLDGRPLAIGIERAG